MFQELVRDASTGINYVKLKTLLSSHGELNSSPVIRSLMPPVEIGSITLVDQIVLILLAKIVEAKSVVEIGTYLGYTTALLAMNTKASIYSVDLPKVEKSVKNFDSNLILNNGEHNDDYLRSEQNKRGEIYLNHLSHEERRRISLVKADSTSIDFKKEFGIADFVFIDGGHEKSIVKSDTLNARSVVKKGVIIWHDFGSKIHNDVTNFLMEESDRKIFHVLGSLCAFEVIGE